MPFPQIISQGCSCSLQPCLEEDQPQAHAQITVRLMLMEQVRFSVLVLLTVHISIETAVTSCAHDIVLK